MKTIPDMKDTMPQIGKVEWIGLRPIKRATLKVVESAEIALDYGLVGDHYAKKGGDRQVTLIQAEHFETVASILQKDKVEPGDTRRNIVVCGINLLAFNEKAFRIGEEVILEMTGHCHPCSRMEENLGSGGYNAMRGHGGITAKVIRGGSVRVGDEVSLLVEKPV